MSNSKELFTFFPVDERYHQMLKRQQSRFWLPDSRVMELRVDAASYDELLNSSRRADRLAAGGLRANILYFMIGDGVVVKCIKRIVSDVSGLFGGDGNPSLERLLRYQMMMEDIHAEAYGVTGQVVLKMSPADTAAASEAIMNEPYIKEMIGVINDYCDLAADDAARAPVHVAAQVVLEGVYFSGSFGYVAYMNEVHPGKFPALVQFNDYILRDEGDHVVTLVVLFRGEFIDGGKNGNGPNKLDASVRDYIREMFKSAVEHGCDALVDSYLSEDIDTLTNCAMKDYYRYNADLCLTMMGLEPVFGVENPLDFMAERLNSRFRITDLFTVKSNDYSLKKVDTTDSRVILPD